MVWRNEAAWKTLCCSFVYGAANAAALQSGKENGRGEYEGRKKSEITTGWPVVMFLMLPEGGGAFKPVRRPSYRTQPKEGGTDSF